MPQPKYKERGYTRTAPKFKTIDGERYQYHKVALTKRGALKEVTKLRKEGYWTRVLKWGAGEGFWAIYKRKR